MELCGQLIMNDDGEFELETEYETVNISQLLDKIYSSHTKQLIYVKIIKSGNILLFEEDGGLFFRRDDQDLDSYFICGNNLSKLLFYNTDNNINIIIKVRDRERQKYGEYSKR